MGKDKPFKFDEEIEIDGETYRRPIRTLHVNAIDLAFGNSVALIGERWGAFVEGDELPEVHARYGLHGTGASEDRFAIVGSKKSENKLRLSINAAPEHFDGWRAWTAHLGFSENDGYWWVEAYGPQVQIKPLVEAYHLRRLKSVSLSLNLRDAFAQGADYYGQEPQWSMTWWFLVDNGYGAFTQATVTALNWNEVPIKLKSAQADEDEGPY